MLWQQELILRYGMYCTGLIQSYISLCMINRTRDNQNTELCEIYKKLSNRWYENAVTANCKLLKNLMTTFWLFITAKF